MEGGIQGRRLVERAVPKPVRKLFRWMNFHFKEEERTIYDFSKTLPEGQRSAVIEHGKDFTTARAKKNTPRSVRNVAASLIVGQGMWYFVCPALHGIPAVRDSSWGWLAAGGLDKLFLKADEPFFQTGGASAPLASRFAAATQGSLMIGAIAFVLDVAADFSRCFVEYWTQKKYGIVADGAARAYGQVRPFPARYSSLEAYQKIISQALRPWTLGTYNQIYNCIYGVLGSLWRTGPQVLIVASVGRWLDNFFRKVSEWVGLGKVARRMVEDGLERERLHLSAIREIVGDEKFMALRLQLAAESRTMLKLNPFRPALPHEKAAGAARAILEFQGLEECLAGHGLGNALDGIEGALESAYGKKRLKRFSPSYGELCSLADEAGSDSLPKRRVLLGLALSEIQAERELA